MNVHLKSNRNIHIDFLRGISILVVMLSHLCFAGTFTSPVLVSSKLYSAIEANGYLGVTIFFVISGYIITQRSLQRYDSFDNIHIGHFFIYRISRILPPLILVVTLNLILFYIKYPGFEIPAQLHISLGKLLSYIFTFRFNLLYTQGAYTLLPWAPLWSLAIEEVFYLCFPITSKILRTKLFMCVLFIGVFIQGYFFRKTSNTLGGGLYMYRGCFDSLALGCLVATVTSHFSWLNKHPQLARNLRWLGLIVILSFFLGFNGHYKDSFIWLTVPISIGTGIFLYGTSGDTTSYLNDKKKSVYRIIGLVGFLSYELYIFHLPSYVFFNHTINKLYSLTHEILPNDITFIAYATLLTACCFILSKYYCEPALKIIRNSANRKININ